MMNRHAIRTIPSSRRLALWTRHHQHAINGANLSSESTIKIHSNKEAVSIINNRRNNCTLSSSYTSTNANEPRHTKVQRGSELSSLLNRNKLILPTNTCHHSHYYRYEQLQFFSTFEKSEYIHPLSQIVLEHLQTVHSDWVHRNGLETGLELNKDGTFVLRFGGNSVEVNAENTVDGDAENVESIWTMYEPTEKKHYLCLSKNKLVGRYLLQDNTKPAWHTDKRSLPERVQDAVDEMVMKVDEIVKK